MALINRENSVDDWVRTLNESLRNPAFLEFVSRYHASKKSPQHDKYIREFLGAAKRDLRASRTLYADADYAESVYHLQQATEKLTKAYALYLEVLNVEEVVGTGHYAPKVFFSMLKKAWAPSMFRFAKATAPSLDLDPLDRLDSVIVDYDKSPKKAELAQLSVEGIRESLKIEAHLQDAVNKSIEALRTIPPEFSRATQLVVEDYANSRGQQVEPNMVTNILSKLEQIMPAFMLHGRFWRLYILCVITYPHEAFTRYPNPNFSPSEYKRGLGIVDAIQEIWASLEDHLGALERTVSTPSELP